MLASPRLYLDIFFQIYEANLQSLVTCSHCCIVARSQFFLDTWKKYISFHPLYSLDATWNQRLFFSSKIGLFLNLVERTSKISKILRSPNQHPICLHKDFLIFHQKSVRTYLGPMLPPDDINWQLIYPNYPVI